jgi:hypothetical protein
MSGKAGDSLFMCFESLTGWRHVTVSARRTKQDWAQVLRDLVDVQFPDAEHIILGRRLSCGKK